jgi:phospholipase D1/2
MIIDDRLLRIGSANLNNRSMAVDTECDLVVEAQTEIERASIARIRNLLLADHCGVKPGRVASELAEQGSLVRAVDRLPAHGHALCPIPDTGPGKRLWTRLLSRIADPDRPLAVSRVWKHLRDNLGWAGAPVIILAVLLLLTLLWRVTPLSELVTGERIEMLLTLEAKSLWAPLWVLLTYIFAGLVAFPVLLLILATAVTFGSWLGFAYAFVGVLASALVTYFVGAWIGRDMLRNLLGARAEKLRRQIERRGILAVAAIRLVPIAPFTFVNLAAGACSIRFTDYIVGTVIGMLPGLVAISALGHQLTATITNFSLQNVALLLLLLLAWAALAAGAQFLMGRLATRKRMS